MTRFMEKRYEYILILAIGITGLILVTSSQQVSALKIDGLWKLNANGEKADLNITVTPEAPASGSDSGLIKGTAHWTGRGGPDPFTTKVIGFWDDNAGKIVFLSENKVVFDTPRPPVVCNTVEDPSVPIENANICHGRDVAFTGYLFGDNNPNNEITPIEPMMMAGVEQAFAGGSIGVGATAERNTFGWCATFEVDMCGPLVKDSAMNATSMSNTSETTK